MPISASAMLNIDNIRRRLRSCDDIRYRRLQLSHSGGIRFKRHQIDELTVSDAIDRVHRSD